MAIFWDAPTLARFTTSRVETAIVAILPLCYQKFRLAAEYVAVMAEDVPPAEVAYGVRPAE